jgi:hypothetical protein
MAAAIQFTAAARRLGMSSAVGVALLGTAYGATLAAGLLSLPSPEDPVRDPFFSVLEILIILLAPLMVVLMVAVHAWTSAQLKTYSLAALVFMSLLAGITCSVHFVVLTISRHVEFAGLVWIPLLLSFKWPSVAYALDILAWDLFFALSMLCAAPVFSGDRLRTWIRMLMIVSATLALAGMSGVAVGDMQLRMIGVLGYACLFPAVALLLAVLFRRTRVVRTSIDA